MTDHEYSALTRSQHLIWTGQRLQPDDPLYNMAMAFTICGPLDVAAFQAAFAVLIRQSDAMRTTFVTRDGAPRQRFHHRFAYTISLIDLTQHGDPQATLSQWLGERAQRPFDLERCLFDSVLLKTGDQEHVWFLNQHHLTTDAWSTSVIFRQMAQLYTVAQSGELDTAPALPSFRDYVAFEEKKRNSSFARTAKDYWRSRLRQPLLPSNFYRPTPATRSGRTVRMRCALGEARSARIKAVAEGAEYRAITKDLARFQLFATALLAWLHRLSGHQRLAIGTPSHSRSSASHKRTIGLFIEIFPLQVEVAPDDTFASLYRKVASAARELLLNAPPGSSTFEHQRAFDVVLNYITAQYGDFAGNPMRSEWVHAQHGDRNHLVRVQVEDFDTTSEFGVYFDLNEDTFVGAERTRATTHFLRILDAMLRDPQAVIDRVDLVSDQERAALLAGAHDQGALGALNVSAAIDRQIERTPHAPALTCGDHTLSFAQLGRAVQSMQRALAAEGIGPEDRVAIALPRSPAAIIAILAVLRAGAAYVPVDPDYPAERIRFMLDDAAVRAVVVDATTRAAMPGTHKLITAVADHTGDHPAAPNRAAADASAYMIYTSGSTGTPKGVDVGHASLARYVTWACSQYADDQPLSWPLFSSLSFDLTVTSVFVPLLCGGRLVIYPPTSERGDLAIRRVIEDNQVEVIKLTPAHLALLATMDLSASRLRTLILGGEDLKHDLARTVSKFFDHRIAIFNEYGPTEATVACMIHRFDPNADTGASVPIGKPIPHARIYILDRHGALQPPGVVGELVIGGRVLAHGYWQRPELTAQRFVDDPFNPGHKMYRSGDLARWRADGTLAYLGRADHQVKVHGVRVELGEIESALTQIDGIRAAVVQLVQQRDENEETFCQQCGLSGRHPNARLDDQQVCHICRVYEDERERALKYFGNLDDLRRIIATIKQSAPGEPDSIMLLSGGKDSTFALCQLVDMGLKPLVFTLDNGFISEGAKANMRRVVERLGLELVVGTTPAMNAIFADSLKRFSNVCNGCFKTIYTLSVNLARERGIHYIFTGLSRGQIFETRVADQFHQRIFDPVAIDRNIIEARKAYHRADDAVSRQLDVSAFRDDRVFEDIQYIDFYRYTDVSLDDMLAYLANRVPWVRPADTGRSTNCLINEAGIFVHKTERGFHNYSLPYSWDVRLGHKQRDAAREELDDHIDVDNVRRILDEVGYPMPVPDSNRSRHRFLTGYYVASDDIDPQQLQRELAQKLPAEFIPARFMRIDAVPLTVNGKVDHDALPVPDSARPDLDVAFVAPQGVIERELAAIWAQVLGVDAVGAHDNFFDLGGDSILNIQIVARAKTRGLSLAPQQIFEHPTIAELARVAGDAQEIRAEQGTLTGAVGLTPVQAQFFDRELPNPAHYNQFVLLECTARMDPLVLEEAVRHILTHHDALRARFVRAASGWKQVIGDVDSAPTVIDTIDLSGVPVAGHNEALDQHAARMHEQLRLDSGPLLRVALVERGPGQAAWVLLIAHHLVMDGVSWWVLLEDLQNACTQLGAGHAVALPPKTTSVQRWAEALREYAQRDTTWPYWVDDVPPATDLPQDLHAAGANDLSSTAVVSVELDRAQTTTLLVDAAARWRTQAPDLLLSALVDVLCEFSGSEHIQIDIEGHGREPIAADLDLLRTVGWFTSIFPVTFARPDANTAGARRVLAVKEQLRAVPDRGISFGVHRYLNPDTSVAQRLARRPKSQVLFNYLGQWDRARAGGHLFHFARPLGASFGTSGARSHTFAINVIAYDGCLRIDWTYSQNLHTRKTVDTLARRYRAGLVALLEACREGGDVALSPADFPTADLDQSDLDDLLADFGEI